MQIFFVYLNICSDQVQAERHLRCLPDLQQQQAESRHPYTVFNKENLSNPPKLPKLHIPNVSPITRYPKATSMCQAPQCRRPRQGPYKVFETWRQWTLSRFLKACPTSFFWIKANCVPGFGPSRGLWLWFPLWLQDGGSGLGLCDGSGVKLFIGGLGPGACL